MLNARLARLLLRMAGPAMIMLLLCVPLTVVVPDAAAATASSILASPTKLRAGVITTKSIELRWTDVAKGETSYDLQVAPVAGGAFHRKLGANSSSYTLTGLSPSDQFVVSMRACDNSGCGSYSDTTEVSTAVTYRVELTWNAFVCDLDLKVLTSGGQVFNDGHGDLFADSFVYTSLDDLGSSGIEQILIASGNPTETYHLFAYNSGECAPLVGSKAQLKIYRGSAVYRTFTVPTVGSIDDEYWDVLTIGPGSTLTVHNVIVSSEP